MTENGSISATTAKWSNSPTTAKRSNSPTTAKRSNSPTTAKRSNSPTTAKRSNSPTTAKRSMNFSESVAIATSSLWAHKLRSVLTLLGVVIGVAAVITVVSLINGANQYVATKGFNLVADAFGVSKTPSIINNLDDWLAFQKRQRSDSKDYYPS